MQSYRIYKGSINENDRYDKILHTTKESYAGSPINDSRKVKTLALGKRLIKCLQFDIIIFIASAKSKI